MPESGGNAGQGETQAMPVTAAHPNHAGAVCPRCGGNIIMREDEAACVQCGHIAGYFDRPYPQSELPYAPPGQKEPPIPKEQQPREEPKPFGLTARQAEAIFMNDRKTALWLAETKWPRGPVCPWCGSYRCVQESQDSAIGDEYARYACADCRRQYSILSGTPMTNTRTRPGTWLLGAHKMTANPKLEEKPQTLARQIGTGESTAKKIIEATLEAKAEGREIYRTGRNAEPPAAGTAERPGGKREKVRNAGTLKRMDAGTAKRMDAGTLKRMDAETLGRMDVETPERMDAPMQEIPDAGNRKPDEAEPQGTRQEDEAGPQGTRQEDEPKPQAEEEKAHPRKGETAGRQEEDRRERAPQPQAGPAKSRGKAEDSGKETGDKRMTPEADPDEERYQVQAAPWEHRQEPYWTIQECRADLVKQREELLRNRDELEAEIREKETQIKRLDEAVNILKEWRTTRE